MRRIYFCISALTVIIILWGEAMAQGGADLRSVLSNKSWKIVPLKVTAQDGATLNGIVEDQMDAVIPEAKLILTNKTTGESREAVANSAGSFSFERVPPGEHSLKAEAKNFKAVELTIKVGAAPPPAIKIRMKGAGLRDILSVMSFKILKVMTKGGTTLSGSVEDQAEGVIPEAKLVLKNKATGEIRESTADSIGQLSFKNVPPGEYTLKAEAKNFEDAELAITVGTAPPPAVKIKMKVGIKEEVTITARIDSRENPLTSENNADILRFDEGLFRELPSQGQNILGLISDFASPAAQGTEGLSISVDGAEVNRLTLPTVAIKRLFINRNPYAAEFRRPGKARVELITDNGSERHYHGSVAIFARNSVFDARNPFARVIPDLDSKVYEANINGPLAGKRATFLLSGMRNINDQSVIVNARTLAGPFVNNIPTPERFTNMLGRIDLRLNQVNSLTTSYDFSEGSERNRGVGGFRLPEQGISSGEREHRFQVSERSFFTGNFLNEVRFAFKEEKQRTGQAATGPTIVVVDAFTGGPSQTFRSNRETTLDLKDIASFFRGRNALRFGGEGQRKYIRATDASNFGGTFEFSSLNQFAAGVPYVFRVNQGQPDISFAQYEAAGFFQDELRLRPNFSLTLGLRYGWQTNLDDHNNFAPRLAFAFAPGKQSNPPKTVIRGGIGVFYERLRESVRQRELLIDGTRIRELVISNPSFPDPFGAGTVSQPLPSIVRKATDIKAPELLQASLALEREVLPRTQVAVEYIYLRGVHLLRSRNINAPMPGTGLRLDPKFLNINQVESSATSRSHAVSVTFRGRVGEWFKGMLQYTYSRTMDDTTGQFALPANNFDLRPEWGRADFDQRHRFKFAGRLKMPFDFRLGTNLSLASGAPYDITTGFDNNLDTVANDRPPGVTRNTAQGAGLAVLDLRLTRRFRIPSPIPSGAHSSGDPANLDISFDGFNALNRTNFSKFIGAQSSPFFGQANSALPARKLQLSLRYGF